MFLMVRNRNSHDLFVSGIKRLPIEYNFYIYKYWYMLQRVKELKSLGIYLGAGKQNCYA